MTLIKDSDFREQTIEKIAEEMCLAARTAPKARGMDLIATAIVKGDTIIKISEKMKDIWAEKGAAVFLRDAEAIRKASVVVLIGTKSQSIGLAVCGFCGYPSCAEREKTTALCAFNAGDLGIAVGSAVALAADHRLDNRLMYSIGKAVLELKLLGEEVKIAYGIPLSATGKNPFFDRK